MTSSSSADSVAVSSADSISGVRSRYAGAKSSVSASPSRKRGAGAPRWFTKWDPAFHREGVDVKAVTYGGARFEPDGGGWRAQLIFDKSST